MLVPHTFPSDGEYTVTVTPIFGDNMSPTGFGSVPCERIEMLLDGKRLSIQNWQGGGRNTPTNCAGSAAARPAPQAAHAAQAPATAAAAGFGFGRNAPPMRVRFKTTAGTHMVGATFPATNLAPGLDLDKHFHALDGADGPDAWLHLLPARRHDSHRRTRSTRRRRRTRRAAARSSSARRRRRPKRRRARAASSRTSRRMASAGRRRRRTSTC